MREKIKYGWILVIVVAVGLLVAFFICKRQPWRQAVYPVHWENDKIQKMVITAYDPQMIQELRKDKKASETYCMTITDANAIKAVTRVMHSFSTAKPACEESVLKDSDKKYDVAGYDADGNVTDQMTIYDRYIKLDKVYELESRNISDSFTGVCAKYNVPHIEGTEDTYMLKQYASEHNVYSMELPDPDERTDTYREVFTQLNEDGNITKQFADTDITNILGVTPNEIVVVYADKSIYAVPYEKEKNGDDQVQLEKSEFLFDGNEREVFYVDEKYIFSLRNLDLYLYDLNNRQMIETIFPADTDTSFMRCKAMRCGGNVVLLTNTGAFYLDEGTTEWKTITTDKKIDMDFDEAWGKGYFIYRYEGDPDTLYCWNSEKKEESVFVGAGQIKNTLKKTGDIQTGDTENVDDIFLMGDTVYLQIIIADKNYRTYHYYLKKDLVDGKLKPLKKMMKAFAALGLNRENGMGMFYQSVLFMKDDQCYLYYFTREDTLIPRYVLYDMKKNKTKTLKQGAPELNKLRGYKAYKNGYFQ